MSGEFRESKSKAAKIEEEVKGEDILNESIFSKKFPLTYEKIKEEGRDIVKTIAVYSLTNFLL